MKNISSDKEYRNFFVEIKQKVQQAQVKALVVVNQHLLVLYWEIGNEILQRQKVSNWGSDFIKKLSTDMKKTFPDMKGFGVSNLKYMRQFASVYRSIEFRQQPVGEISWSHNILLIQKCKDEKERLFYAQKALENGWSRNMMVHQIELDLYNRQGKVISNFEKTLPTIQSDMAQQIFKDPYILDFLNLREDAVERELEDAIMNHITKFLLELGVGFAFVGRQYRVVADEEDYAIDMLFYHLHLRCYVVIDLKMKDFKPEYAGKMNFYLSAVDDQVKQEIDNPSIGIILCRGRKNVRVEYTLKDINKPIGISEYQLTNLIPKDLKSKLPTIEDLERELLEVKKATV
ncbi:MAG: YhcG family protein [Saprospiraceae bacterium]